MGARKTLQTPCPAATMNITNEMDITNEQLETRQAWIDQIDDFGLTQDELNKVMAEDLTRWIDFCNARGWNAEAIDIALGLA